MDLAGTTHLGPKSIGCGLPGRIPKAMLLCMFLQNAPNEHSEIPILIRSIGPKTYYVYLRGKQ